MAWLIFKTGYFLYVHSTQFMNESNTQKRQHTITSLHYRMNANRQNYIIMLNAASCASYCLLILLAQCDNVNKSKAFRLPFPKCNSYFVLSIFIANCLLWFVRSNAKCRTVASFHFFILRHSSFFMHPDICSNFNWIICVCCFWNLMFFDWNGGMGREWQRINFENNHMDIQLQKRRGDGWQVTNKIRQTMINHVFMYNPEKETNKKL